MRFSNSLTVVVLLSAGCTTNVRAMQVMHQSAQSRGKMLGQDTSTSLSYFGGSVKNNIDVQPLLWPNLSMGKYGAVAFSSKIAQFYMGITKSVYMDWLLEYSTPSAGTIGRGRGRRAITLTGQPTSTNLDGLLDIQPFLVKMYREGKLKLNKNSYFPIHFGPNISITEQGFTTCVNLCAYHSVVNVGTTSAPMLLSYGVIPDHRAEFCQLNCGSDMFDSISVVASHELIETITDPTPLGSNFFGWYNDQTNEEIGDLCNWIVGSVTDSKNETWIVQYGWSNLRQQCFLP